MPTSALTMSPLVNDLLLAADLLAISPANLITYLRWLVGGHYD
jgi:hypothetical protein